MTTLNMQDEFARELGELKKKERAAAAEAQTIEHERAKRHRNTDLQCDRAVRRIHGILARSGRRIAILEGRLAS